MGISHREAWSSGWIRGQGTRKEHIVTPLVALQMLFYLLGGFGLFFVGIGVLWFVSVYKAKNR